MMNDTTFVRPSQWRNIPEFNPSRDELYLLITEKNLMATVDFEITTRDGNSEYVVEIIGGKDYIMDSGRRFIADLDYSREQTLIHIYTNAGEMKNVNICGRHDFKVLEISGNISDCFEIKIEDANMFSKLKSIDIKGWSRQTCFSKFLTGCSTIENVSLNTGNAIYTNSMFEGCRNLKFVNISRISELRKTAEMFSGCRSLVQAPMLNLRGVESSYGMFKGCSSLIQIPEYDTSNIIEMYAMFEDCTSLESITKLDTDNATDLDKLFSGCKKLVSVPKLNTAKASSMSYMFKGCESLLSIPDLDMMEAVIHNGAKYVFTGTPFERNFLENNKLPEIEED